MATQELSTLFRTALQLADQGELDASAEQYEQCLRTAQSSAVFWEPEALASFLRSAAINLAQVLNRQGRFEQALKKLDQAMAHSPTSVGRAIALAARGEALCGIGKIREGAEAFDEAVRAQSVVGSLNAADSMTRITSMDLLEDASRLVTQVLKRFSDQLSPTLRAEAYTIHGKIALREGHKTIAHEWFRKALAEQPDYADAQLHMRALEPNRF